MPKYFTHYWTSAILPYSMKGVPDDPRLTAQFARQGVVKGDVIFVINGGGDNVGLLGTFTFGKRLAPMPTGRPLPFDISKRLKSYPTGTGAKSKALRVIGTESLRGVRRLVDSSGRLLEDFMVADDATASTVDEAEDVDPPYVLAEEGRPKLVPHLRRERDWKLVKQKRQQVLSATGRLACEACGFEFEKKYGALGSEFCEVHHNRPLSGGGEVITSLDDLAITCSYCHRMIHKSNPMLSIQALACLIKKQSKAQSKR